MSEYEYEEYTRLAKKKAARARGGILKESPLTPKEFEQREQLYTKYRQYVDSFDITEEQKKELVRTVWKMMEPIVDQAFGIDIPKDTSGESNPESIVLKEKSPTRRKRQKRQMPVKQE